MSLGFVLGVSLVIFALVMAFMAVGVIIGRRQIRGSCGGLGQGSDTKDAESCSLCANPAAACRELSKRMEAGDAEESVREGP